MKAIKYLSILLCASTLTINAQGTDNINGVRSVKANSGGQINVTLLVGSVKVLTWDKNEVAVKAEDVDEDEPVPFELSQSGNTINVKNNTNASRGNSDIRITVPLSFNVYIKTLQGDVKLLSSLKGNFQASTDGGNISLENINGYVNVKTFGGNILTSNIIGDAVLSTNGGEIHTGNISGKCDVNTLGGNIVMKDVGRNADVKTNGGDISIHNIGGSADIMTLGGSISILKIAGSANIETNGGDIKLNGASDLIDAETKGGDIELHNIYGSIKTETMSGDIYVELKSAGNKSSSISTMNGGIKLLVDPNLKINIYAKSIGSGDEDDKMITSDFPAKEFSANKYSNEQKAEYQLNGGGVRINLSTINGEIEIRKIRK